MKLLSTLTFAALLTASAFAQGTDPTSAPSIARAELGETRFVAQPTGGAMVTIRVVFDAGSAEDPAGQEGVTALTASLMREGGAGGRSYTEITEALFPMAAELDAYTTRDQTVFFGRVHRDHLDAFYAIFNAVLADPMMDPDAFERLRRSAVSTLELTLRGNNDEELGKQTLHAMLYEGHPFAHPPPGRVEALSAVTLDDLAAHRGHVFCGARAIVGVSGGYPDGFAERVRADVSALGGEQCLGRRELPSVALAGPRIWLVQKDEATSSAVSMGMPIDVVRGDADYPALVLAGAYFGQHRTFAGRLMGEMRGERGLNYGDYAYIEHFDQDGWSALPKPNTARRQQYFSIWLRPVNLDQAHFAIRMAVRELRELVANGLTEEQFQQARSFVQGYYALYLQTESRQLGFAIDDIEYGQTVAWIDTLQSAWSDMTVDDVNAAIRAHIDPTNLQIALVHPDAEAFADVLASEAPSPIEYPSEAPADVLAEDEHIIGYEIGIPRDRMFVVPVETLFE